MSDPGQRKKLTLNAMTCRMKPIPGQETWISAPARRGAGRLVLRITKAGAKIFYYRYTGGDGERVSLPIGEFAPDRATLGRYTLAEATNIAAEYSRLYQSGIVNLREHLERVQREREEAARAEELARQHAEEDAKRGTLKQLLDAYVKWLEVQGKVSAKDVKGILNNHFIDTEPELCARKAKSVKTAELRQALAKVIEKGHRRTAAKLRSFIRAAYSAAVSAETDPDAPAEMMGFGLESNPAAILATIKTASTPGERVLDRQELREYLLALDDIADVPVKETLRLCLYLLGQRPTQLLRVRPIDVDLIGNTITQFDGKGRRSQPRVHILPLAPAARAIVCWLHEQNKDKPSLFMSGEKSITTTQLSEVVSDISTELLEKKKIRAKFRMGDLRRTCETMSAAMGISKDVRAQIQSHGLGGVQSRHYDRHDYAQEKWQVFTAWEQRLAAIKSGSLEESNVVEIRSSAA